MNEPTTASREGAASGALPSNSHHSIPFSEIVDLSHDFFTGMANLGSPTTAFWPTDTYEKTRILSGGRTEFEARMILMSEHCGTHLDAPRHYDPTGESTATLPLERLVLPGHLLDFTDKSARDPITPDDLERAAAASGREVAPGTAVLAWTGQDKHWGEEPVSFPPTHESWVTRRPYFPAESAQWLVAKGIGIFGTDIIGIDDPDEWWNPTHDAFCRGGLPFVQQLCNLDKLKGREFWFIVLPLKMRDGTASPARPVALVA
jgi:kynurenine formamidase